jgi:hypothetical protein
MHKDTAAFKAPAVSHAAKLSLVPSPAEHKHTPADDGKVMGQGPFNLNYFLAGAWPALRARAPAPYSPVRRAMSRP